MNSSGLGSSRLGQIPTFSENLFCRLPWDNTITFFSSVITGYESCNRELNIIFIARWILALLVGNWPPQWKWPGMQFWRSIQKRWDQICLYFVPCWCWSLSSQFVSLVSHPLFLENCFLVFSYFQVEAMYSGEFHTDGLYSSITLWSPTK